MPKSLVEKFSQLSEGKKKFIAYTGLFIVIVLVGLFLYSQKKTPKKKEEIKFEEVVPEVRLLEKTLYEKTTLENKKLRNEIKKLKAELRKTQVKLEAKEKEKGPYEEEISKLESRIEQLEQQIKGGKPLKGTNKRNIEPSQRNWGYGFSVKKNKKKSAQPSWIGGVGQSKASGEKTSLLKKQTKEKEKKEEKEKSVYLPPCWVKGDLLTGLAAFTSQQGKNNPVQILIRLKDLAVLPNEIKADLKGCYVIAEAYGNLADERVHVRLLRLSCISRDGSSVIDEPVKGWVVDEDGGVGLRGFVVAKMGAFLSRYMLAGFLEGFGDAYSSSAYNLSIGGGNVVTLANPKEATKAGIGKGINKAGEGLGNFYLDLARQTLPVIIVGAGKEITVVFNKGKELAIRKKCLNGRNGCIEKNNGILSALAVY